MTVTLCTSQRDALLLDCALRRAAPGSQRHAFLLRIGRSLGTWGALTPAMTEAVFSAIQPST
jgi:hypothetical protein